MILVTGGSVGAGSGGSLGSLIGGSVEVLSAAGTPLRCTLPTLPSGMTHTQDGLLSCGGLGASTTCVKLSDGGWVVSHNLRQSWLFHSSWMSPAGLVLMGGYPKLTAEVFFGLGGDSNSTFLDFFVANTDTELLSSSDSSTSSNFTLEYDAL